MFEKFHRKSLTATLAALMAALGVGGVALAQNSASSATPSPAPAAAPQVSGQQSPATADTPESPSDQADPAAESGSETVADDGPGGHADEPGNPSADHQFQGQE